MGRSFEDKPAVREATPLLLGIVGPSGGGKTYSALRLATGIQRVTGGDITVIDTEARRACHYADRFTFRHLAFAPPFGSLDYLEAIEHCAKKGARVIVVDSMSHEHEGPGGLLEQHERALKGGKKDPSAWIELKANRRRLLNGLLQLPCSFILCFRAKDALHFPTRAEKEKGMYEPEKRGWMPIAGADFVFELAAKFLLLPGAEGKPTWTPEYLEERAMVKLPAQFREMFPAGIQLSEDLGEGMARWAAGADAKPANGHTEKTANGLVAKGVAELLAGYATASSHDQMAALKTQRGKLWPTLVKDGTDQMAIRQAAEAAAARMADQSAEPGSDG